MIIMESQEAVLSEQIKNANAAKQNPVADSGFVSCDNSRLQMDNSEDPSRGKSCGVSADIQIAKRNFGLKTVKTGLNDLDDSGSKSRAHSDVAKIPDQAPGLEFGKQPYDYFFKQDSDGDTQLHIAIAMRLTEAALWLIDVVPHVCLLDLLNNNIHTALQLAVLSHEPLIVRRLIVAGANPEIRSAVGNTALHLACALGDLECVRAITDSLTPAEKALNRQSTVLSQNLDTRNFYGKTCLHIAAANGHVYIVEQLLRMGANINTQEGHAGMTCLHLAIESGHLEVVRHLSQQYRDCLDAVTYAGVTTYQLAMEHDPMLANELAEQYGLARIVHEDNSSDTGMSSSDNSSDDESMSSGNSEMSDDQPEMYSPVVSPFLSRDWLTTRMRSS